MWKVEVSQKQKLKSEYFLSYYVKIVYHTMLSVFWFIKALWIKGFFVCFVFR